MIELAALGVGSTALALSIMLLFWAGGVEMDRREGLSIWKDWPVRRKKSDG